jgi:hypothetical protein
MLDLHWHGSEILNGFEQRRSISFLSEKQEKQLPASGPQGNISLIYFQNSRFRVAGLILQKCKNLHLYGYNNYTMYGNIVQQTSEGSPYFISVKC